MSGAALNGETGGRNAPDGLLLGRLALDDGGYPRLVTVRDGWFVDITSAKAPTVRDICELPEPAGYVRLAEGTALFTAQFVREDIAARKSGRPRFLAPVDLQVVKASGVTFVASMLEQVIEEKAQGTGKVPPICAGIFGR